MISENIYSIREKIRQAARTAGTPLDQVRLVAVTKTVDVVRIKEALDVGITEIGENRVQELCQKAPLLSPKPTLHLIGHLQTNKAKEAVLVADFIQSVDTLHLAEALEKHCSAIQKKLPFLIQVNTSGEESKFGVSPKELFSLAESLLSFPHLELRGLMTIAPKTDSLDAVRPVFEKTRNLFEQLSQRLSGDVVLDTLSMGMSNDYIPALLEGATIVRIGRGIFGERV